MKWKLVSAHLEIVLISKQDRFTVCAERAIGSESVGMNLIVLLGDVGDVEARFSPFRYSVNLDTR